MRRIMPPTTAKPSRPSILLMVVTVLVAFSPTAAAQDLANHQLCIIRPDGTGFKQITDQPDLRFGSPSISPDGRQVAADCTRARLTVQDTHIVVMDVDGDNIKHLATGAMPSWSPGGALLAYHAYSPTPAIMVMNADGTGREEVANHWGSPRWTPGGDKLISLFTDGTLRLLDLRTGKQTALLRGARGPIYPGFGISRDGARLCYCHQSSDGLGVVNLDKNWQVVGAKLYLRNSTCRFSSFSPDGSQVAFSLQSNLFEKPKLHILDLEGEGSARPIDGQPADSANVNPQWSPDGEWIVFSSDAPE